MVAVMKKKSSAKRVTFVYQRKDIEPTQPYNTTYYTMTTTTAHSHKCNMPAFWMSVVSSNPNCTIYTEVALML